MGGFSRIPLARIVQVISEDEWNAWLACAPFSPRHSAFSYSFGLCFCSTGSTCRKSCLVPNRFQDFGYLNIRNGGGWTAGNPDLGFEGGREEYVVFSGQTGDAMLGEYTFSVKPSYSPSGVTWTLTALVGDAVVWSETGSFESSSDWFNDMFYSSSQATDSFLDDDSIVSSDGSAGPTDTGSADRRLSTTTFEDFTYDYYTSFSSPREYFDDDFSSYSSSYSDDFYPQSDVFTVTLDTYNAAGC